MTSYGYARISTEDQNLDLQTDALKKAGCTKIITEKLMQAKERPALNALLEQLKKGDTIIVWKLYCIGSSIRQLIELLASLKKIDVRFMSIKDKIDTADNKGYPLFETIEILADFDRDVIRERTNAGLVSARSRGKLGGRPEGLTKEAQIKAMEVYNLYQDKSLSIKDIVEQSNVSVATVYKYIRFIEAKIKAETAQREIVEKKVALKGNKAKATSKPIKSKEKVKTAHIEKLISEPLANRKGQTIISMADAKNMVETGVADCSTEIIETDGSKKLMVFNSVKAAIKKRAETNSNARIWIWNKETSDIMYVVDENKKPL